MHSPGRKFRRALAQEKPLQVVGAVNAYTARLAQSSGFTALYVSGGGVAASYRGIPDLGITEFGHTPLFTRRNLRLQVCR